MEQPTAFLVTPFSPEAAGDEDPAIYREVQDAIVGGATAAEVTLQHAGDIFRSGVVIDQVRGAIETADVIIGVCTGRNANVFYELGLAEVVEHKPILIAATKDDLPFDLAHWRAQMYAEGDPPSTLAERVRRAIVETLAARDATTQERAVPDSRPQVEPPEIPTPVTPSAVVGASNLSLTPQLHAMRDQDWVVFNETTRGLVDAAGEEALRISTQNRGLQPSGKVLEESRQFRFDSVERLLDWCVPAIQYQPQWLDGVFADVAGWFHHQTEGSAFQFWTYYQTAWTSLFLRSALAVAARVHSGAALRSLLGIPSYERGAYDTSPLLINTSLTWTQGYAGNSRTAFDDFVEFAEWSAALRRIRGAATSGTSVACGSDLIRGLAKCAWDAQSSNGGEAKPHIYAGFALHPCRSISWAARLVEQNDDVASSFYGFEPEQMRALAREWYPNLAAQVEQGVGWMSGSCETWDQALKGHW